MRSAAVRLMAAAVGASQAAAFREFGTRFSGSAFLFLASRFGVLVNATS